MGNTVLKPKSEWPENFKPDPEDESCGIYMCPDCETK
jgi:hypothetical protein